MCVLVKSPSKQTPGPNGQYARDRQIVRVIVVFSNLLLLSQIYLSHICRKVI